MNQDWREELGAFLEEKRKDKKEERRLELERFLQDVALAAFRELKGELEKHGRLATIREAPASASIKVTHQGEEEITADELAGWMGTISYEVLCLFGNLNHRVMVD